MVKMIYPCARCAEYADTKELRISLPKRLIKIRLCHACLADFTQQTLDTLGTLVPNLYKTILHPKMQGEL